MNIALKRYSLIHYLLGALPARLGDEMSGQAILLLGVATTGSVAAGSKILAGLTFSAAIGGPILGTALDRSPHPGKLLAGALAVYALGLACVAALLGHTPLGFCVAVALTAGLCMPAISGGWSSRLKSFTTEEAIPHASAIDAATFNLAGLVGPTLAGIIAVTVGAGWAITVLIALLLAALPMALLLPKHVGAKPGTLFWRDVLSGLEVILHSRPLLRITLLSAISYMGIGMLWVLYPLLGQSLLGGAGYGSALASVVSLSALGATAAYAKWAYKFEVDTVAGATTAVLAVTMLVTAFSRNSATVIFAMLLAGLADGPQLAAIFAVRHREAPERLHSQVFMTGASLKITAAAGGTALAGLLAGKPVHDLALLAGGVQIVAGAVFLLIRPSSRPAKI